MLVPPITMTRPSGSRTATWPVRGSAMSATRVQYWAFGGGGVGRGVGGGSVGVGRRVPKGDCNTKSEGPADGGAFERSGSTLGLTDSHATSTATMRTEMACATLRFMNLPRRV